MEEREAAHEPEEDKAVDDQHSRRHLGPCSSRAAERQQSSAAKQRRQRLPRSRARRLVGRKVGEANWPLRADKDWEGEGGGGTHAAPRRTRQSHLGTPGGDARDWRINTALCQEMGVNIHRKVVGSGGVGAPRQEGHTHQINPEERAPKAENIHERRGRHKEEEKAVVPLHSSFTLQGPSTTYRGGAQQAPTSSRGGISSGRIREGGQGKGMGRGSTYLADAGSDPRAVVVELLHAVVAHAAVGATGRPVGVAGQAELCLH